MFSDTGQTLSSWSFILACWPAQETILGLSQRVDNSCCKTQQFWPFFSRTSVVYTTLGANTQLSHCIHQLTCPIAFFTPNSTIAIANTHSPATEQTQSAHTTAGLTQSGCFSSSIVTSVVLSGVVSSSGLGNGRRFTVLSCLSP